MTMNSSKILLSLSKHMHGQCIVWCIYIPLVQRISCDVMQVMPIVITLPAHAQQGL